MPHKYIQISCQSKYKYSDTHVFIKTVFSLLKFPARKHMHTYNLTFFHPIFFHFEKKFFWA